MRHQANDIIIAVLAVITALCLSACGGQKATETAPIVDSMDVPVDTMAQDSIDSLAANQPIPKAADEYFNDFIYSFTSNRKYQLTRVRFPLPVQRGSQTTFIQRAQWHFTRLHFKEAVYTVFFDNKRSLDLEKSKTLKQVSIQWFHMKRGETESYLFHRGDDGQWRLEQIKYSSIDDYADAAFIKFYQRFASDEAFQRKHLAGEISFKTPDPEDEFEDMTGTIAPSQWRSFRPELLHDDFTNIDYGQSLKYGGQRIVALEGSSNGFLSLLFFRHTKQGWQLYRLEN